MGNNVAVQGCSLVISSGGSGPAPSVTNSPSTVIFANGKGVFFDKIEFSVSGATAGDIANSDGHGTGSISGTGDYILDANGASAVLEGDESVEITINGTKPNPSGTTPPNVPASGVIKVKVQSAGQTDVVAL